ncbi:uncharacterized protein PAE49_018161 isoform 2-T2 [Odontesthes bonariensis]|uniref:uncharacterized protein LOC142385794 isoform X2 n=1 Tax=Odontesthes bonariensis TaxID=219752 RepID=UPI003F5836A0
MSTSDSDCSIDWLASDEDTCDSLKKSPPLPSSSSAAAAEAATYCRDSPANCFHYGAQRRRSSCDEGRRWGCSDSAVSPVQGFTSVCAQQTFSVEAEPRPTRKRARGGGSDAEGKLFSHKCLELQCYVQPLASILRGLRAGRYSERLSSFQESVAIDRIQRITGVLQSPNMGGSFLSIILKIEEMLRSWFPRIKPNVTQTDGGTPAKRQKQHSSSSAPPSASNSSARSLKPPEVAPIATATHLKVTQDSAVSSSTDLCTGPPAFTISSPCLERLLRAKESLIAVRTEADGGVLSHHS